MLKIQDGEIDTPQGWKVNSLQGTGIRIVPSLSSYIFSSIFAKRFASQHWGEFRKAHIMTCANSAAPLGLSWDNATVSSDGKAVSRGIAVGIGSPQQIISLRPSVGDSNIWVFNADDCGSVSNSSCIGSKGGVYNSSSSHTFVQTTKSAWNGTQETNGDPSLTFIYFNDDIYFGTNGSSPNFPLMMDTPGQGTQSGLGIGPNSTFLDAVVDAGLAPYRAWGLWVGSRSVVNPVDGSLWVGGYDTSRITGRLKEFPILNPNCATCVVITNITYQTNRGSTSLMSNSTATIKAALEPFSPTLEVPNDIFINLIRATGGSLSVDPDTEGSLIVPSTATLGNLSITLSNGYETVIPAQELFLPPRKYNDDGVYTIVNDSHLVSQLVGYVPDPDYVFDWGIPYLTMNYMIVDYENSNFSMAPALQGPYGRSTHPLVQPLCNGAPAVTNSPGGPSGSNGSATNSSSSNLRIKSHSDIGAIAGGVVGGVIGLAIIAILIFFVLRSRRREAALRRERDSVMASTVVHEPKDAHDKRSECTATSPTEVSEMGVGEHGPRNISSWLNKQEEYRTAVEYQPMAATLQAPFEMPTDRH